MPLHGLLDIEVGERSARVDVGEAILIRAGQKHSFRALETASFMVADMNCLPERLLTSSTFLLRLNEPMQAFLHYAQRQLETQANAALEDSMFGLFYLLLDQLETGHKLDKRIDRVLALIRGKLDAPLDLPLLSRHACLSQTQLKKLFRQQMGMGIQAYIISMRMEKARALLTHTDLPVHQVAEQVGYLNPSAFTRRFRLHFGDLPSRY